MSGHAAAGTIADIFVCSQNFTAPFQQPHLPTHPEHLQNDVKSGDSSLPYLRPSSELLRGGAGIEWGEAGLSYLRMLFDMGWDNPDSLATFLEEKDPLKVSF